MLSQTLFSVGGFIFVVSILISLSSGIDVFLGNKYISREEKKISEEKVLSFQKNHSLAELSRRLNIPGSTLANWTSRTPQKKCLKIEAPVQSFVELPAMTLPNHRVILNLPSGMEIIFEGEVKAEYLAQLALALSRRELS